MTAGFVEAHRARFSGKPFCAALQVAPLVYWSTKRRLFSPRALRDAVLLASLSALQQVKYSVYGAHKIHIPARRAGCGIRRDQVALDGAVAKLPTEIPSQSRHNFSL